MERDLLESDDDDDEQGLPPGAAGAAGADDTGLPDLETDSDSEQDSYFSAFLEILRGWRLVKAANLDKGEKRDLLATTRSTWDYARVSDALQALYGDEDTRAQNTR